MSSGERREVLSLERVRHSSICVNIQLSILLARQDTGYRMKKISQNFKKLYKKQFDFPVVSVLRLQGTISSTRGNQTITSKSQLQF